jgi:hypothetical protein
MAKRRKKWCGSERSLFGAKKYPKKGRTPPGSILPSLADMPDWWKSSYERGAHSVKSGDFRRSLVQKITGSEIAKPMSTEVGTIRPDLRGPGDVTREVKTGLARWSLEHVRIQLDRMLFLRALGYTTRLEYWFVESPYSHTIGPDLEFEKALRDSNIPITYVYKNLVILRVNL